MSSIAKKILICGGGCAGPALGYWLAQAGHQVTIVERFPALRATGAQIDLRGQGIEAIKRMGLLDAVQSKLVDEAGVAFVNSAGKAKATIMANTSGKGAQSLTSEYEIMRGDLVRILYDATKDKVQYIFGKSIESFNQDDHQVTVCFSDGTFENYDLLVGADGQGSRIRKAILPLDSPDPYLRMGIHMGYYFIPRTEDDNNIRRTYNAPGGRMVMRRSHSPTETQVYFFLREVSPEASYIHRASVEVQKKFWAKKFQGAGWQTDRFLAGMETAENFYSQEVIQIRTDTWFKGRVVLLGDAAHCPSPFSGMGTTGGLVGAWILAGEITRNPNDPEKAFANYDKALRPYINVIQSVNPTLLRMGIPRSQLGIRLFHAVAGLACLLRIPDLVARFSNENKDDWKLPEYPELSFAFSEPRSPPGSG